MSKFYTSAVLDGKYILYRGVENGNKVQRKVEYNPKLYIRGPGSWRALDGTTLQERQFKNIWEAVDFIKRHDSIDNFSIFGNQRWQYAFIGDEFPGLIDYDLSKVISSYIDIEVADNDGFPLPEEAKQPITAITLYVAGMFYVFGFGDFEPHNDKVKYFKCKNEIELITLFLDTWELLSPDIISGWNIEIFDIPYFINRATKLLGAQEAAKFSPWKKCVLREQRIQNRTFQMYDICGVAVLDYIQLYKKFAPQPNQESYTLENISDVELSTKDKKISKVDWKSQGYKNLVDLAKRNHQLFIEYNLRDVDLVVQIENKLKLIELAQTLAYMNHVNYDDVFSQGRMWDAIIFNKLKERKIAVPPTPEVSKKKQFEGAYVKEPNPGWYHWLASFDLTSLYPHLIMMYNLSPETLLQPDEYEDDVAAWMDVHRDELMHKGVELLLSQKLDTSILKKHNLTLTPNAQLFRRDRQGILGELMETMFTERAKYKKMELAAKKEAEKTEDKAKKELLKKQAASYKAFQMALKVTLNSAYGSIGNMYFRYFDIRIAEAVTLTGQLSIRWIQQEINKYFNKVLKTENVDYVLASDTDSVYLNLEKMVQHFMPTEKDPKNVIAFLDKICEQKIKPFIDDAYNRLADYINAYAQKMVMKREALADQGIWVAKKNYILSVYNNEGVEYDKPDIKITGWAAVRTTIPKLCREKLKDSVALILSSKEEKKLVEFVNSFREEFNKQPLIKIANPSGISELDDYSDIQTVYSKGTPIHVKGALLYNHHIRQMGLEKKYEQIKPKDKIKYLRLKSPNPFQCDVMAFLHDIPVEFGLEKYLDIEAQFQKTYIQPLELILNAIGWKLEREDTLESLFG